MRQKLQKTLDASKKGAEEYRKLQNELSYLKDAKNFHVSTFYNDLDQISGSFDLLALRVGFCIGHFDKIVEAVEKLEAGKA